MGYHYATKDTGENTAKAVGIGMTLSTKQAIELCRAVRSKELDKAKTFLQKVIRKEAAVPYTRFNKGVGHRRGKMAAGRYPGKAAAMLLKLLESAEANAQLRGLDTSSLLISSIIPNQGNRIRKPGRQRSRLTKSTHIEVVVKEQVKKQTKKEKTMQRPATTAPKHAAAQAAPTPQPQQKTEQDTT